MGVASDKQQCSSSAAIKNQIATAAAVRVRPFAPADAAAVAELFTEGMCSYEAHQDAYNLQYIASCLNDDLADIQAAYITTGGNFWVATMPTKRSEGGESEEIVVGMVGLERQSQSEGELRRLSVKRACFRMGIGRLLVDHLETWAKTHGIKTVTLSTGVVMHDAIKFYTKCGYRFMREEPEAEDYWLACFAKQL